MLLNDILQDTHERWILPSTPTIMTYYFTLQLFRMITARACQFSKDNGQGHQGIFVVICNDDRHNKVNDNDNSVEQIFSQHLSSLGIYQALLDHEQPSQFISWF